MPAARMIVYVVVWLVQMQRVKLCECTVLIEVRISQLVNTVVFKNNVTSASST